jgi:hypothetical protein
MRQDSRAKDISQVREASDIGVGQDFVVVVIDEAVLERVDVRDDGKQKQQDNQPSTRETSLPARAF